MTLLNVEIIPADLSDDDLRSAGLTNALDLLGVGAFLVRHDGRIVDGNAVGWSMVAHEGGGVEARLRAHLAGGGADESGFDLVRLAIRSLTPCYLAIAQGFSMPSKARLDAIELAWSLTLHQRQVLELVVRGAPQRVIARLLDVDSATVEERVGELLRVADAEDRNELLVEFWSVPLERAFAR